MIHNILFIKEGKKVSKQSEQEILNSFLERVDRGMSKKIGKLLQIIDRELTTNIYGYNHSNNSFKVKDINDNEREIYFKQIMGSDTTMDIIGMMLKMDDMNVGYEYEFMPYEETFEAEVRAFMMKKDNIIVKRNYYSCQTLIEVFDMRYPQNVISLCFNGRDHELMNERGIMMYLLNNVMNIKMEDILLLLEPELEVRVPYNDIKIDLERVIHDGHHYKKDDLRLFEWKNNQLSRFDTNKRYLNDKDYYRVIYAGGDFRIIRNTGIDSHDIDESVDKVCHFIRKKVKQ